MQNNNSWKSHVKSHNILHEHAYLSIKANLKQKKNKSPSVHILQPQYQTQKKNQREMQQHSIPQSPTTCKFPRLVSIMQYQIKQ